jgi:hypothetical protein
MSTTDTTTTQGWKKEVQYLCEEQIGHVIGGGGVNVKKWLSQLDCTIIIDKPRKCIVIFGKSKDEVLQTTIEVQDKLFIYLRFIYSEFEEHKRIIDEKDIEIARLKMDLEEERSPWEHRGKDGKPLWSQGTCG